MDIETLSKAMGELLERAMDVADHSARSDIEIFAHGSVDGKGNPVFNTELRGQCVDESSGNEWEAIVANAVRYIELRQMLKEDALPFKMTHIDGLVWFEARPT